jgi:hypothetical protein
MSTEKPTQEEKDEATRQLSAWIMARCDIEDVPQLVSWLELAKPRAVIDQLMSALSRHRRRKIAESGPKA